MTLKIEIFGQNLNPREGQFWPFFWGPKSRFQNFFKVVLEMFRKCLSFVFGLKGPTFGCILSSKSPYVTSKIEILGQKIALFGRFEG